MHDSRRGSIAVVLATPADVTAPVGETPARTATRPLRSALYMRARSKHARTSPACARTVALTALASTVPGARVGAAGSGTGAGAGVAAAACVLATLGGFVGGGCGCAAGAAATGIA